MKIDIPADAEQLARGQAAAAGFMDVGDYIANLIRNRAQSTKLTRQEALSRLRQLRADTPKLTPQEIVEMVGQARAELP